MGHRSKREKAPAPRPRLLIVEPHAEFRRALRAYLEAEFEIVAAVADGTALDKEIHLGSPDVIVCDLAVLPSIQRWVRGQEPPPRATIVGITLHDAPGLARRLRWRRLAACVPKWATASELTPAIQAAAGRP